MSKTVIAHLRSDAISTEELHRLEGFIAANQGSSMAIFLQRVVAACADGQGLDVFADDAELTPNEAAHLLKMSRPHLLSFMDHGDLEFHYVGSHRRIKMSDLKEFMAAREAGAEILANALYKPGVPVADVAAFTDEELEELDAI